MSNVIVGDIYRQVIDRVAQHSQNDFEEMGYLPEMLPDVKAKWQENLSKLQVAQMPWDPKPQPPQPPPASIPKSDVKIDATAPQNGGAAVKSEIKRDPPIKVEDGSSSYNGQNVDLNGYAGSGPNPLATQRASTLLQSRFGDSANASIQAAGLPQQQRPLALPGQQQRPQHIQLPGQGQSHQPGYGQTDGAVDYDAQWKAMIAERRATAEETAAADDMLRRFVEERMSIHDGGVLESVGSGPSPSARSTVRLLQNRAKDTSRPLGQTDGADEEDEDAINSDLDDPDDEVDEAQEDDDGPLGEMILCTWDKVNRVKNKSSSTKWKCTLKDGVLATGGKEYLFHKATGEFEW